VPEPSVDAAPAVIRCAGDGEIVFAVESDVGSGIVAPPGPVSADALTFTLVKPPEGACTMT